MEHIYNVTISTSHEKYLTQNNIILISQMNNKINLITTPSTVQ